MQFPTILRALLSSLRPGLGGWASRAVRSAHATDADVERRLLVLFFVVFAVGAIVVVVQGSTSGQSFSALVGGS
jgi:hypothetical protein